MRRPPRASCEDVVRLLTDYQEDALPMAERLDFERHVAVCPACRGYMSQMRAVLGAARAGAARGSPLRTRPPCWQHPNPQAGRAVIAYKFLNAGAVGLFSRLAWPVPNDAVPGAWVEAEGPLEVCRNGIHACGPGVETMGSVSESGARAVRP